MTEETKIVKKQSHAVRWNYLEHRHEKRKTGDPTNPWEPDGRTYPTMTPQVIYDLLMDTSGKIPVPKTAYTPDGNPKTTLHQSLCSIGKEYGLSPEQVKRNIRAWCRDIIDASTTNPDSATKEEKKKRSKKVTTATHMMLESILKNLPFMTKHEESRASQQNQANFPHAAILSAWGVNIHHVPTDEE